MGRLHRGGAPALSLLGGLLSCQGPGSLLPAPEDAPGGINPPPCSQSQRQSQRAACCSQGVPRAEDLRSGPGEPAPPRNAVQRQGGPVCPGGGPCPKAGSWAPRPPAWCSPLLTRPPDIHAHPSWRPTSQSQPCCRGQRVRMNRFHRLSWLGGAPLGPA